MAGLADVRTILASTLDDVEALATSPAAMQGILGDLRAAERLLWVKLNKEASRPGAASATDRFTGASAEAYLQHCRVVTEYVTERIAGRTQAQAKAAIAQSLVTTATTLEGLEQRFTGITPSLRLREAAAMRATATGAQGMWARQFPTSMDRYGSHMIGEFENIMRAGMLSGASIDDMVAALTGHGGPKGTVSLKATVGPNGVIRTQEAEIPEGLFVRHKYWAERLVRTELLRAYNVARQAGLEESAKDMPDLQRKILAVLDKRTAKDSLAVHGQIRGIRDNFVDGAGRSYLHPPARPNDRETVIPWRPRWDASAANTSEWEKACMGELDEAGEDALFERMKTLMQPAGKPKTPKGPKPPKAPKDPLTAAERKLLGGLPQRFRESYSGKSWRAIDANGNYDYARPGKLKFNAKHLSNLIDAGHVRRGEDGDFHVVPVDVKPLPKPPMLMPRVPTFTQKVEAELRDRVKIDHFAHSYGGLVVDGEPSGHAYKDSSGTFGYSVYRNGQLTKEEGFPTPADALVACRGFWYGQAAEAAKSFRQWDKDAYHAAVAADDTAAVRGYVRGLLWEHDIVARDPFRNGRTAADTLTITPAAQMPTALAWHKWTGEEAVRDSEWIRGKGTDADKRSLLETLTHEELHGSSRTSVGSYQGRGACVEEVTVEMSARYIVGKALNVAPKYTWGSYQPSIDELTSHVDAVTSSALRHDALEAVAKAGVKMRQRDNRDIASTPDEAIKMLVKALGLDADKSKALTARFKTLRPPR